MAANQPKYLLKIMTNYLTNQIFLCPAHHDMLKRVSHIASYSYSINKVCFILLILGTHACIDEWP